jgi:transposase InsO family protein
MTVFEYIESEKASYSVTELCTVLGVSRSGFHKWRKAPPSQRRREDERLGAEIRAIHRRSRERYGSPRVHAELRAQGRTVGRKRVARLMGENGLKGLARRRFRRTTDSAHKHPVAANLLEQNFGAAAPNQAWVGDITYVWTLEGWAYLAVLLDLYSRRVVGWALRRTLSRELALGALRRALRTRGDVRGLVHHTDRGSQYASHGYRQVLAQHGLRQSMSGVGNCYDNAVAESFFASLKKELVHRHVFATRTEAYDAIADYIENFYNAERRHSAIGYATPVEHEQLTRAPIAA